MLFSDLFGADKFGRAGFLTVLLRLISVGLTVVVMALAARVLGVQDFGYFAVALGVGQVAAPLISGGLDQLAVRTLPRREEGQSGQSATLLLGTLWRWALTILGLGAVASAVLYVVGPASGGVKVTQTASLALAYGVARACEMMIAEVFRGTGRPQLSALVWGNLVLGFFLVVLLLLHSSILELEPFAALLLAAGLGALASLFLLRRETESPGMAHSIRWTDALSQLRGGVPLALAFVASASLTHVDIILAGFLLRPFETSLIGVAYRLVVTVSLPLAMLNQVAAPVIARAHYSRNLDDLERFVRGIATLAAIPGMVAFAVLTVFGRSVLELLFGTEFVSAYLLLVVLLLGRLAQLITGPAGTVLVMTGEERLQATLTGATVICKVLVGIAATKLYGVWGLVLSSVLLTALLNFAMALGTKRRLGLLTLPGASIRSALEVRMPGRPR